MSALDGLKAVFDKAIDPARTMFFGDARPDTKEVLSTAAGFAKMGVGSSVGATAEKLGIPIPGYSGVSAKASALQAEAMNGPAAGTSFGAGSVPEVAGSEPDGPTEKEPAGLLPGLKDLKEPTAAAGPSWLADLTAGEQSGPERVDGPELG